MVGKGHAKGEWPVARGTNNDYGGYFGASKSAFESSAQHQNSHIRSGSRIGVPTCDTGGGPGSTADDYTDDSVGRADDSQPDAGATARGHIDGPGNHACRTDHDRFARSGTGAGTGSPASEAICGRTRRTRQRCSVVEDSRTRPGLGADAESERHRAEGEDALRPGRDSGTVHQGRRG